MATHTEDPDLPQSAGERATGGSSAESGSNAEGTPEKPQSRSKRAHRRPELVKEREPPEEGNSIRASRTRSHAVREEATVPQSTQPGPGVETGSSERRAPPSAPPASGNTDPDPWTVPASVRDRFIQDGRRFYFPDGHPAFQDHGRRLSTASENTEVVHGLIEIAHARGWQEITVGGTERFRQEAWRQGRLAGLAVRGYKPSEAERAALIRGFARHAEGAVDSVAPSSPSEVAQPPQGETAPRAPAARSPDSKKRDELIVGKLVDFGHDTYKFDPHEEMSYFVQVQTPEGNRTIWGQDLQRALAKSLTQPQIGDEIALRRTGSEAVTVNRRERNAEGELLHERPVGAQRHRWVVERAEFFASRTEAAHLVRDPTIEARQATASHPELAGTYLQLRAAQLAARLLRDPQDQQRFVALVRGALAESVARGEPLQPVRLREREPAERSTPRRSPERAEPVVR